MFHSKNKSVANMSLQDISKYINEHLPIRTEEKDKFGEVFTPIHLINEILDALPNHVWKDPKLKWLDPAAGVGNFGLLVYYRLMNGLKSKISDFKKK
jgi:type I restriction-modification system DNA methylase subunit